MYRGVNIFPLHDLILVPLTLAIILMLTRYHKNRYIRKESYYKYFSKGVYVKLGGVIGFILVYVFYYGGGDTILYFQGSHCLTNLFWQDIGLYISAFFEQDNNLLQGLFSARTGVPVYWNDKHGMMVIWLINPIVLLSGQSFLVTSLCMAMIGYSGLWRLFKLCCNIFPFQHKKLAFAILFVPSIAFWGSGILKDTWTLSATCWYFSSLYYLIAEKKGRFRNLVFILISVIILIKVKPYIVVALMPVSLVFVAWNRLREIKNKVLKVLLGPIIFGITFILGAYVWSIISPELGEYGDVDTIAESARVKQLDLQRSAYGGNSFNIGDYDSSVAGMLSRFPEAVVAGLYRPFVWESNNLQMLISGMENLFVLLLSLLALKRSFRQLKELIRQPFFIFCVGFAILFAFSVGISTSNFGALVRLKLPLIPFFTITLFILYYSKECLHCLKRQ